MIGKPYHVRKLTILGRVLPARVVRYDRKWGLRTSPTALLKKKTPKRKVQFGWGREFHYLTLTFLLPSLEPRNSSKIGSRKITSTRDDINCEGFDDTIQLLRENSHPAALEA